MSSTSDILYADDEKENQRDKVPQGTRMIQKEHVHSPPKNITKS
jgi:hypothetical protein